MRKVFDFIKKAGAVLYDLYVATGRWMNVLLGGAFFLIVEVVMSLFVTYGILEFGCCAGSAVVTFLIMLTAELKDKEYRGKFDWKELNASMLMPIVLVLASVVMLLIR